MTNGDRLRMDLLRRRFVEAMTAWNWSRRSVVSYEQNVRYFCDWLDRETEITDLAQVTCESVAAYQTALLAEEKRNGERLSVATQHHRLCALKGFLGYLWREGKLLVNPAAQVVLPKKRRSLPQANVTSKEAIRVLEAVDTRTPLGMRDRAMLEVLYATGMRNAELRALSVADIGERTLWIRAGKGGKDRLVPVGAITWAALSDYVQQARPALATRDGVVHALFLTKSGRSLDTVAVINAVRRAARRAGLKKDLHPHSLRHACATHMLKGGADIRHIQKLLGHASLQTTEIYTKVEIGDLKAVHRLYHPRERRRRAG